MAPSKRLTGFRFQTDATMENLQPMLDAVSAALRGDRAHALCHPCFYTDEEEGIKNMNWHTKIKFTHWSSWAFNEKGHRFLTTLVSFGPWFSPKKRALIQWIEREDGSTLSFAAHFGSFKEIVQGMSDFNYKLYIAQTRYISWEPTEYNKNLYEGAIAEAEKAGNTALANQLQTLLDELKVKLAQYERIQDQNELGEGPWDAYQQARDLPFSVAETSTEPCECEDYLCDTKEATLYETPKVEGAYATIGGVRLANNEYLFHNILLYGLKRETTTGFFRIGAWDYRFAKGMGGFTIYKRTPVMTDLNAEEESLFHEWNQSATPLFLGIVHEECSGHCDPDYCSNHFCGDEKFLYEFVCENGISTQLAKSYKLSYLHCDNAPKKEAWEPNCNSLFYSKPITTPLYLFQKEDLALPLLAAGTEWVKRAAFLVGDWCYPVTLKQKNGKRTYTIKKRVARVTGNKDMLYWF